MSKVNILATLKSKDETVKFDGKGIKNNNKIIYLDDSVKTILDISDVITIERTNGYYLKIYLKKGHKLKGEYKTNYGNLSIHTYTKDIIIEHNKINIIYDLYINEHLIDTFIYNLEYSIDS